jgi:Nif-specific regulatory protein
MLGPDITARVPPVAEAAAGRVSANGEGSLACEKALARIELFLRENVSVVMEGEPGAGKEFHARLLHRCSLADGGFVEVSPHTTEEVLRAILFNDDRRVIEQKLGRALPTLAGNSTLFLRDVVDFSIIHQRILSRFLISQESEQQPLHPHTRVIVSSDLSWGEVMERELLVDSLSRNMQKFHTCRIPPLRERFDEIPSLVHEIISGLRTDGRLLVNTNLLEQLKSRQWRDNIRELKYIIEEAAANAVDGNLTLPPHIADEIDQVWEMFRRVQAGKQLAVEPALATLEKSIIQRALLTHNFDQRKTARMLAMTEPNLTYRIKKFNIYIPTAR